MEQSGRFPVLHKFPLGAGRVKLAKTFRANARHCLAVAKKQQTIKARLQWLEKAAVAGTRTANGRIDDPGAPA